MRASSRNRTGKPRRVGGSEDLTQEVASLSALDAAALRQRWANLFGKQPSPRGKAAATVSLGNRRSRAHRAKKRVRGQEAAEWRALSESTDFKEA